MLAAGHRRRIVVEDLVSDIGSGRDGLTDRETAGMEIGAIAEVGEYVFFIRERRNTYPRHALAAHVGVSFGVAIHPQRHEVAADTGKSAASIRHFGRSIVRAARAEIGGSGDRGHGLHLSGLAAVEPV